MEPQGVDVPALLRRTLPLWLAWVLYAAPALWAVQVFRAVTAMPNLPFNDTTIYDENGTVISNGPGEAEPIGWLARFGVSLVLSFGTLAPAPPELPLFGLGAAVVVSAVWTVRARSFHLRSVAAVGALFSVGLAVVGLLVVVSRDATHEAVRPMWGPEGLDQFDGQFAVWGTVGVLGAILAWTFARLGFGPLPMRHSPDPAATRGATADAEAISAPVGVPTEPPEAPTGVPSATGAGGTDAGLTPGTSSDGDHAADLALNGWDVRPELPPDFVAPEAGSSLFERPTGRSSWADNGSGVPVEATISEDPLAVYRRPSGPDS